VQLGWLKHGVFLIQWGHLKKRLKSWMAGKPASSVAALAHFPAGSTQSHEGDGLGSYRFFREHYRFTGLSDMPPYETGLLLVLTG